jgi:hypothetical protein
MTFHSGTFQTFAGSFFTRPYGPPAVAAPTELKNYAGMEI